LSTAWAKEFFPDEQKPLLGLRFFCQCVLCLQSTRNFPTTNCTVEMTEKAEIASKLVEFAGFGQIVLP